MLFEQLHRKLLSSPDRHLMFCSRDGTEITKSFSDVDKDVALLMSELQAHGLGGRDLVGLVGNNSYEWVVADLALLGLDAISIALPVEMLKERTASDLMERYEMTALLFASSAVCDDLSTPSAAALNQCPLRLSQRPVRTLDCAYDPDIFSIVFSSGTSGKKKGLLMSKSGVANTITSSGTAWKVCPQDQMLIVMPFSNFQQRYLLYMAIWYGFDASIVAPERMFRKLRGIGPTIIVGPPSFFEWLENKIETAKRRERMPLMLAAILHSISPDSLPSVQLRRWLCRAWSESFGPRIRLMFVGSAPSRPTTLKIFHRIGLPLFEVYGSTEAGWITFNLPESYRFGSVGRAVKGVSIEITEDQEVRMHSKNPQSRRYIFEGTEDQDIVFLPGSGISTGDLGHLDKDGFLHLVGRKKNVIITRSGVKISPEEIESEIESGCRIQRAVVLDTGRRATLSCVVWIDKEVFSDCKENVRAFINSMNGRRPASQYVGEIIFRPAKELTTDAGLLTRNYKINRTAVMSQYFSKETGRAS